MSSRIFSETAGVTDSPRHIKAEKTATPKHRQARRSCRRIGRDLIRRPGAAVGIKSPQQAATTACSTLSATLAAAAMEGDSHGAGIPPVRVRVSPHAVASHTLLIAGLQIDTYDTVVLKSDRSMVGVVTRTPGDVNTHQYLEGQLIFSHVPVPEEIVTQFLENGVPPKGYVYVAFAKEEYGCSLVAETDVILLARSLSLGAVVKRVGDDGPMTGIVTNVAESYSLEPIVLRMSPEIRPMKSITMSHACDESCSPRLPPEISHPWAHALIYNVPGAELKRAQDFREGDRLIYQDWFGVVDAADIDAVVVLPDRSLVMVENAWELEILIPKFDKPLVAFPEIETDAANRPDITSRDGESSVPPHRLSRGQVVVTHRRNLKDGRWLSGKYRPDCHPMGVVLDVRARRLDMQWLAPNMFSPHIAVKAPHVDDTAPAVTIKPYENLSTFRNARDIRRNKDVAPYAQGRLPRRDGDHTPEPLITQSQNFRVGEQVRFRDQAAAAAKYQGTGKRQHGRFDRLDRDSSLSFDMNEFKVVTKMQEVTVVWQDQSVTTQPSTSLVICPLAQADMLPGDLITGREGMLQISKENGKKIATPFNEMSFFEGHFDLRPKKVGVIQSIDSAERLAKVRWFLDPKITLIDYAQTLTRDVGFGPLGTEIDDVSLYEVMSHPALSRRRRDLVYVKPERPGHGLDWVGQVVDIGVDGYLTVRLGASEDCRDLRLTHDEILGTIDDEYTGDDEDEVLLADIPDGDDDYESESDESAIDEVVEYEGGHRIDQDSGDEMWLTDDEAGSAKQSTGQEDVDMKDAPDSNSSAAASVLNQELKTGNTGAGHGEQQSNREEAAESNKPVGEDSRSLLSLYLPAANSESGDSVAAIKAFLSSLHHTAPPRFDVLPDQPPSDQFRRAQAPASSPSFMKRVMKEHKMLASSLPEGEIYVRTYESRTDLLRCLIIGPSDTPYEFAPFLVDLHLSPDFPYEPPTAHFHSWTSGLGRINPNLYEEGKICLSLLGTWPGQNEGEGWSENATLLQLLVSLQGLVFVKRPFYNEAGFEGLGSDNSYTQESQQYSEKAYVMARKFVEYALKRPPHGVADVLAYHYFPSFAEDDGGGDGDDDDDDDNRRRKRWRRGEQRDLLRTVVRRARALMEARERRAQLVREAGDDPLVDGEGQHGDREKVFLKPLSRGAEVMLDKTVRSLDALARQLEAELATLDLDRDADADADADGDRRRLGCGIS